MTQQSDSKKYTVALPQTTFPMKGDLPKREPELLQFWEQNQIAKKLMHKNQNRFFVLPDGPPYANGSIHIGHALNKTLKDIIIKYKNLQGYQAVFRPGWDCHGLPIEQSVAKKLGDEAKLKTPAQIRELCRAEAAHWVGVQKEQFKRLGVFADWENPYLTMDPAYEAQEVREFAKAFEQGVVYRGLKPVYWNWSLQTALAEAEVEYHPHKSPSIYVSFPQLEAERFWGQKFEQDVSFLIWTTTPWTLPANVAVCLNKDFVYGLYRTEEGYLVLAKDLAESVSKETNKELSLLQEKLGSELQDLFLQHPFIAREVPVIFGEHVTKEAGTGCVHTAPGHGPDDYMVGLKYQLPILSPVGPDGCFLPEVNEFAGIHILKANPLIVEKLNSLKRLFYVSQVEHSYPHCWRTKIPLIYRATHQWFMGLDQEASQIRKKSLAAMEQIAFFPDWGRARFKAMIENRPDWCLSRQRVWGVPIPVLICKKTGEPLADYQMMLKIADAIENQGGIEAFYQQDPNELAKAAVWPTDIPQFGTEGFTHSRDILDVWFDSGICHAAVQAKTTGMSVPADIYLEGSDQHRGWFNTSMLTSMVTNGHPPFKALVTHGFIQQAKGVKMSKSKGGGVDPLEFSNTKGADILRLWCAHEDYGKDIIWGDDLVERVTETYRRLRNTFRFLAGVLADFNPQTHKIDYQNLTPYDQWALHRLNQLIRSVTEAYDEYAFYRVYHLVNQYVTVDLSALYLDILKDRLYTFALASPERRSGQTVVFEILNALNTLIAPILSFLAEEVYQHRLNKDQISIFLEPFAVPNQQWDNSLLAQDVQTIFVLRDQVQKQLEDLRNQKVIGSSLEASVHIYAEGAQLELLQKWSQLREILIVSELLIKPGTFKIEISKVEGLKCPRCWVYTPQLDATHGVCQKCLPAVIESHE